MGNDIAQLTLSLLVLIFGAGLEELLPKFFGVGFPVLLCAAMYFACRRSASRMVLFAIAAGAVVFAVYVSLLAGGQSPPLRWDRIVRVAVGRFARCSDPAFVILSGGRSP